MPPTELPAAAGDGGSDDPEILLWHRAALGDPAARAELAQVITEVARPGCARIRCCAAEAEELASRLQASVWQLMRVARTTPRTNLRAFLRNRFFAVSRQYFREMKKVRDLLPLLDDDALADPDSRRLSAAEQQEIEQALHACLDQLPSVQRQAIERRYFHHETVQQCQEHLASSNANTIRVWIHRGVLTLCACLRKKGFAP